MFFLEVCLLLSEIFQKNIENIMKYIISNEVLL